MHRKLRLHEYSSYGEFGKLYLAGSAFLG